MVALDVAEERGRVPSPKSMAMGHERSRPLHNFTLPCLKWGNQRHLRCMKVSFDGGDVSASGDQRSSASKSENSKVTRRREPESEKRRVIEKECDRRMTRVSRANLESDAEDGIEAVREKLMFDLKTAADKMKDAIFREEAAEDDEEEVQELPSAAERPWNLRKRRAACKSPIAGDSGKGLKIEEKKPNCSPLRTEVDVKSPRLRGTSEKKERPKFSVPLSKKEIEEDFMEILGHRPPRRPKKRARVVQKQLDSLFPGLWLTEVNADLYKVPEIPENGKR
ncbi:DUF1639 family protein [Quillaja saponaria]|uniref:DUF1639 family protein n=1 Tax=Quillaja saponaria TaxID=32244 RepID=A0AAD7PGK1_QUISA|nr:DUF1639 family protein [Quillaja saponaria]KAJ7954119.1 DUF1639 family protein [Quillaja saponaria]